MKNLIIIDRDPDLKCIIEILGFKDNQVAVLIVETDEIRKSIGNLSRIKSIYTVSEILNSNSVENLDYELIKKYKGTQLRVENALDRLILDHQIKKSIYYSGLSFWKGVFDNNHIDAIIINGLNHGMPYDGIPCDIGIQLNISVFTIDPVMDGKRVVYNNLDDRFLKIQNKKIISIDDSKYYSMPYDEVSSSKFSRGSILITGIAKIVYKIGGFLALEFFYSLKKMNFKSRSEGNLGIKYNYIDKLQSHIKFKKIKKQIEGMSSPYAGQKCIFYAMHFEPEGGITARVTLESQLIIIKMLAKALPKGWMLCVKEHPHQFELNNWLMHSYINNIEYFKSKEFYLEIVKLKNVKLIDRNFSSQKLIQEAEAVATLFGTIALEATEYSKPVLLFGHKTTPLRECDDFINITSYKSCFEAIKKIQDGYKPNYKNLKEILNSFLVYDNIEGYRIMISALMYDLEGKKENLGMPNKITMADSTLLKSD